jgi:hypothetical protein
MSEGMTAKSKYLLTASVTLTVLIVGMTLLGVFSKDRIMVTTLATTGPHFEVVLGRLKLKMQMPDSVDTDVSGVMVSDKSLGDLDHYLRNNYQAFGDYFILTEQVIGIKQSDNLSFHPLMEIHDWRHVSKGTFWLIFTFELVCLVMFVRSAKKCLTLIKH